MLSNIHNLEPVESNSHSYNFLLFDPFSIKLSSMSGFPTWLFPWTVLTQSSLYLSIAMFYTHFLSAEEYSSFGPQLYSPSNISYRKISAELHRNTPTRLGETPLYALCTKSTQWLYNESVTVIRFVLHICILLTPKHIPLFSNERSLQYRAFNYMDGSVLKLERYKKGEYGLLGYALKCSVLQHGDSGCILQGVRNYSPNVPRGK
jgi:hypothetical protein